MPVWAWVLGAGAVAYVIHRRRATAAAPPTNGPDELASAAAPPPATQAPPAVADQDPRTADLEALEVPSVGVRTMPEVTTRGLQSTDRRTASLQQTRIPRPTIIFE